MKRSVWTAHLVITHAYALYVRGFRDAHDRDVPDGNVKALPVCAVPTVSTTAQTQRPHSRERYDPDEPCRKRYPISVDMRDRKRLWDGIISETRMQDLNHVVWIEAHVELELFHVTRMFCGKNPSQPRETLYNARRHTSLKL